MITDLHLFFFHYKFLLRKEDTTSSSKGIVYVTSIFPFAIHIIIHRGNGTSPLLLTQQLPFPLMN